MTGSGQQAFLARMNVSRETCAKLEHYERLLRKWSRAINLVARPTLEDIWTRHFLDSAQLHSLAPETARTWADLGSGGGFPGLVIAILAAERSPFVEVTLVEADRRKAAFLTTVSREMGLNVRIHAQRIEALAPLGADVVSARALAPLVQLLDYARRHLAPGGIALFPKGAAVDAEIDEALASQKLQVHKSPSWTDPRSTVLRIEGLVGNDDA